MTWFWGKITILKIIIEDLSPFFTNLDIYILEKYSLHNVSKQWTYIILYKADYNSVKCSITFWTIYFYNFNSVSNVSNYNSWKKITWQILIYKNTNVYLFYVIYKTYIITQYIKLQLHIYMPV